MAILQNYQRDGLYPRLPFPCKPNIDSSFYRLQVLQFFFALNEGGFRRCL